MTTGPGMVGAATDSAALLPGGSWGATSSLPAPLLGSFAATLEQLTSTSTSGETSGETWSALGDGLFVGDLGTTNSPAVAGGATAGLASEMAVVALLTSPSTSSPVAASPVAASAARTPQVRTVTGPPATGGRVTGSDIVDTALLYRGTPYVWGGTSPSGFDCSGFTQYVYARWGVSIPRTSEEQATVGTPVASLASAQPGDLLFFAGSDGTASSPGHVGIYVGNGEMIDSPYTGTTVQVQSLSSAGPIVAIRRILGSVA